MNYTFNTDFIVSLQTKGKTLTDQQILKGIAAKDTKVFDYIYQKYGPMVVAYVLKNSGTKTEGMEVLQISMLKVWDKIKNRQYEDRGMFGQFLYTIAANTWKEELRRKRRKPIQELGKIEELLEDQGDNDLYQKVVRNESMDAIYRALDQLEDLCRDIIELYHLQEVPLKEIAKMKNYDYNNLRKRIFNCRKKLKKLVEQNKRH